MDDVFEFLHTADEQLEKHGNAIEAATKVRLLVQLSLCRNALSYFILFVIMNEPLHALFRSITKPFT